MTESSVEERVTTLEELMAEVLRTLAETNAQIARTNEQLARTDEQLARTQAEVERTSREMREFKEEMRHFREEMQAWRKEMNRKWGELANKMGTMAEDLVAPSIPRILRTVIGCPDDAIDSMAVRVRRRHPETRQMREFDVVATCGEYVFINETKSRLRPEDIQEFVRVLEGVRACFPEYADRKIIGCIASLYVDPSLVRLGERAGLVVLGFGEDVMDVLNSPEFTPRVF